MPPGQPMMARPCSPLSAPDGERQGHHLPSSSEQGGVKLKPLLLSTEVTADTAQNDLPGECGGKQAVLSELSHAVILAKDICFKSM